MGEAASSVKPQASVGGIGVEGPGVLGCPGLLEALASAVVSFQGDALGGGKKTLELQNPYSIHTLNTSQLPCCRAYIYLTYFSWKLCIPCFLILIFFLVLTGKHNKIYHLVCFSMSSSVLSALTLLSRACLSCETD